MPTATTSNRPSNPPTNIQPDAIAVDLSLGSQSGRDLISELIVGQPAIMGSHFRPNPPTAHEPKCWHWVHSATSKSPQLFTDGALADRLNRLYVTFRHAIDEDANNVIPMFGDGHSPV